LDEAMTELQSLTSPQTKSATTPAPW